MNIIEKIRKFEEIGYKKTSDSSPLVSLSLADRDGETIVVIDTNKRTATKHYYICGDSYRVSFTKRELDALGS